MNCIVRELLLGIESHPGTAAWLQAIGAVAGLAVAIWVPARMAKKNDAQNRRRFLESVASIGGEAQECLANAAMQCHSDEESGRMFVRSVDAFHRFRLVSKAINEIPVHQLQSYILTRSVLELQVIVAEGLMRLDTAFKEVESNNGYLLQYEAYGEAFNRLAKSAHPHLTQI